MWQLAYAELYFSDCYWPEFSKEEYGKALSAYACRERRFGGVEGAGGVEAQRA
jgi:undecaprenyl diphosphate synthase